MSIRCIAALALLFAALPASAQSQLFEPAPESRGNLSEGQSTYLHHLETHEAFVATDLVFAQAELLREDGTVTLELPGGQSVVLLEQRMETRTPSDYAWIGRGNTQDTEGVFVVRDGRLTGTVRAGDLLYTIRHLGDGLHAVVQLDESAFVDHPDDYATILQASAANQRQSEDIRSIVSKPVMHLIVAYTAMAVSELGSPTAVEDLIQLAETETNQGYINSGISARVKLAYVYQTSDTESGVSMSTDLGRFRATADGFFDEVHAYRDGYVADLAILIVSGNLYGGSCGVAYVNAPATSGFSVVGQDCATGYYSFGHEIGHNQGMRHNPEQDPTNTPYAYAHGKYHIPGNWRTVMSYSCSGGCTRRLHFSNPDVSFMGEPTGDTTLRDNARLLDEQAASVAGFRVPQVLVTGGAGWRFMASPVDSLTLDGLASQNLVQGIPDYYPAEAANFFTGYDGAGWTTPTGGANLLTSGSGFAWYFFNEDFDPGGASASVALPMTLITDAYSQPSSDVMMDLHSAGDGWNLIGNPFVSGLDVSGGFGDWVVGGDLASGVGQVWDPEGSYITATAMGVLEAWQSVLIENSTAESMTLPAAFRTLGGASPPGAGTGLVAFELSGTDAATTGPLVDRAAILFFQPSASDAWDIHDAVKLIPPTPSHVLLAFDGERDAAPIAKAQESRSLVGSDGFSVPLHVQTLGAETDLTLAWPRIEGLPTNWQITLQDIVTGDEIDLLESSSYSFTVPPGAQPDPPALSSVTPMGEPQGDPRFMLTVEPGQITGSDGPSGVVPTAFALEDAYPNPFNPSTTIRFDVASSGSMSVLVFDLLGRQVATLLDEFVDAGSHAIRWDARSIASGMYVVQMRAGDFVQTRRVALLK